jgi:hypothetical protein
LALGPVIPADDGLIDHAERLDGRYEALMAKKPVDRHDYELAYFACVWRASLLLQGKSRFLGFRERFSDWVGVGEYAVGCDVGAQAIRHAQCVAMAETICYVDPTLVEHYWLMAGSQKDLKKVDDAVLLKLTAFVEDYTGRRLAGALVRGQTTISLATWSGWKSTPKAA